ncbi:oligosaccharide flippase family protein [Tropicimonas sp. TH_r6]|uniref:oligosaccharide flippase family protein n=1 Tax=Tropicimonas sp. TH_r6 TaxID=3082085 RepID=UPI0029553F0C|nr:oligosaccharide flippase family protein [Tropicimonas sp. TH_r6]MDV7144010.1 oligosaccharide flippase family protein [Tropicimonas sp. TH_r6]
MTVQEHFARYGPFARNLLAYAASEAAAKASRLLVVVAVARTMDAAAIGVAAAALAASDILKALTENGAVQRIIAAPKAELEATCRTARRIFTVWCLGLFLLQASVAGLLLASGGSVTVSVLILVLAGEYLFMPAGLVQVALAMREGKLRQTAAISAGQVVGANFMCVVLAILWPGPLALVLPRLMSAPIWLIAVRRLRPWRPDRSQPAAPLAPFLRFGWAVLGVEVVKALRLQADKLLVGLLLGAESLGLYFMAFNAGLGLANSFSVAFATVLYPHLCGSDDRANALQRALFLAVGIIAPVVILQSLAAPYYVPLLFGEQWADLSHVVSILCLAAIPGVIWSAAAQWLRAENRPEIEFLATAAMTVALIANTALMAPHGLEALAWGYLAVATITQLGAALRPLATALKPKLVEA